MKKNLGFKGLTHLCTRMVRLLTTPSKNGNGILTPSLLSQKHISERVGGSYPTSKAIEMLEESETLGYGCFEDVTTPNKRTIKQFRKRRLEDLRNKCKDLLKRSKISDRLLMCLQQWPLHYQWIKHSMNTFINSYLHLLILLFHLTSV